MDRNHILVGDLADLVRDWSRSMRVANRSSRTIETYNEATTQLLAFLAGRGHSLAAVDVGRRDIEEFILALAARCAEATVSIRYRALQAFFKFHVGEGELSVSPMAVMRPPSI